MAADETSAKLPDNVWVRLCEEETGARDWPLFTYAPQVGKFVLSGGVNQGGGKLRHFDTEFFDLSARRWVNGYPAAALYKNLTGPTDAPGSGHDGWPKKPFQTMTNGITRVRMDDQNAAYGSDTRLHHQYALHGGDGRIHLFFHGETGAYDPQARQWSVLPATNFVDGGGYHMMYGSLAYDPINREIICHGGTSQDDGGSPGTWRLAASDAQWERLDIGTPAAQALSAAAHRLDRTAQALVNRWRNRFYLTESVDEAKAPLAQSGGEDVQQAVQALLQEVGKAQPAPHQVAAYRRAAALLRGVIDGLPKASASLSHALDGAGLQALQRQADLVKAAAAALDCAPSGRGHAQMATDPTSGKIVLFGGSRIDSFLSDTWVYDCQTRTWEQRFPKGPVPPPRAGHALAWLPGARRVVLSGGYDAKGTIGADIWLYDIAQDRWQRVLETPAEPQGGVAAVGPDDTLVLVSANPRQRAQRITWACRVVAPATVATAAAADSGVPAATVAKQLAPEEYDGVTQPDPAAVAAVIKAAPVNQWTLMPKPPKSTATRDWGTLPYDTDRHQILHWGGGHSTYAGTDLAHYSMRSATWSLGYAVESYPTRGFFVMANQTFNNRPNVPNHVWDAAAYDPVSRRGVWLMRGHTWTYDPATRAWDYPPAAKVHPRASELKVGLASTPRGVVCWFSGGLHLFDAKTGQWQLLPLEGGQIGEAYGDTSGICHDSRRDVLWLTHRNKPMMEYGMANGKLTIHNAITVTPVFMRETVYLPEVDMLLNMMRVQGDDGRVGNCAYDIANDKWVGLELPFADGQPYLPRSYFATAGSRSLHYDPTLKLAIFFYGSDEIWFAKIDKAGLKTIPVKPAEPPAK